MARVTGRQLLRWARRAETIRKKAAELMDDMMLQLSDEGTDPIDNVLHCAEDLCCVLGQPDLDIWQSAPPPVAVAE